MTFTHFKYTIFNMKQTKEPGVKIRMARPCDAAALLSIYAPYVLHTPITFEYTVPSEKAFAERMRSVSNAYPYLVSLQDGQVTGYAYAAPFRERAAYNWCVEVSIYIKEGFHGKGIGKALYTDLEHILMQQNILNLYACITYPNPESIGFHQSIGYQTIAHFKNSGYKSGCWHDMIFMEKFLKKHPSNPEAFIPINQLNPSGLLPARKERL